MERKFKYIREYQTRAGLTFQLRPAIPADTDIIENNINVVCAEKIYLHSETFIITPEWCRILAYSVDEKCGDLLIVAQVENEIVGHLRIFSEWYGERGRHVGIVGLSIVEKWRQQGIGTAMLAYAIEWAKHANFLKLWASVIATNQRALMLFTHAGFSQEGLRKKQFKIDENYFNELLLARFLQ